MPSGYRRQLVFVFVSATLTTIGNSAICPAGEQRAPFPSLESIEFGSHTISSRMHPFVFVTKGDIRKARKRIRLKAYSSSARTLGEEAEKARIMVPASIDPGWWEAEKDKAWGETYPIIYQKTCLEPVRIVLPGYYAALRYAIRGGKEDLAAARKILLHLADYSFEFEHYDVGMNYSVWGHFALNAYDLLYEDFSEGERERLDGFFTRMGRAVLKNDIYWIENDIGGGINNHLAWHKMMLGCLGVFYGREELVEFALHGRRGLLGLLDDGMVDDGLWCESSLNYHFTAIVPMIYLAEALRNTNYAEDLYGAATPGGRNIRQAYDSMFGVLFPDGSIPPIGDAYGRRKKLADEFTYLYARKAYGDPRYAWLLKQAEHNRPEALLVGMDTSGAEAPKITSRLYEEHGYAFLRNRADGEYWGSESWCAFLTFDKSGVHCNQDKLSLMLFGRGMLLIPDVEAKATVPHAFSAKVQRELNRSALSQNTVMIDNRDQRGTGELLTLVEFRDSLDEKSVTAADYKGALYEGVRQSRTITVTADYVLDVFQISAKSEHNIKWLIHTIRAADSQLSACETKLHTLHTQKSSVELKPVAMTLPGPGSWLRDFRAATTDGDIRLEWSEGSVNFAMTMAGEQNTRLITCGYPTTDEADCPTIPMVMAERRAAGTVYAAVYQAGKEGVGDIRIERLADAEERLVFEVAASGGGRKHFVPRLR